MLRPAYDVRLGKPSHQGTQTLAPRDDSCAQQRIPKLCKVRHADSRCAQNPPQVACKTCSSVCGASASTSSGFVPAYTKLIHRARRRGR